MIECKYPLYSHQQAASDKLSRLRVGALYMEMGTGKTRTMVEILKGKIADDKIDKIVWFCPCSAKENIRRDLEKHLVKGHEHFIIVGIESISSSVRLNSYLLNFVENHRCALVVDESLKIKNPTAKRTRRIIALGEKCRYRYILNGTPVSRDERDLFAQWYFLDWRILGYKSQWSFENKHCLFHKLYKDKIIGTKNVDYLARCIAPYTYQVKLDECVDLPGKTHQKRYFDMHGDQSRSYDYLCDYLLGEVNEWKPETIYRMFSVLQGVTAGYIYELQANGDIVKKGYANTVADNPRLAMLMDILEDMDGKVIIYCEYRDEVETIVKLLGDKAVPFYGGTNLKERDKNIQKFEKEARFLVASKDCAAYSLNLQFCHQVIYYNNDWDYGTREQSENRTYRIGQKNKCLYIDIVASDSVEEHIIECLERKANLVEAVQNEVDACKDKSAKDLVIEKIVKRKRKKTTVEMVGELVEGVPK